MKEYDSKLKQNRTVHDISRKQKQNQTKRPLAKNSKYFKFWTRIQASLGLPDAKKLEHYQASDVQD
jgi:hypothetical protein